jgi:hypothetical protein
MRRRVRFIHNELPMLRARPLRAASTARLIQPRTLAPISETSHQIREKSRSPKHTSKPATSTSEKTRRIWDKSHTTVRAAVLLFRLAPVLLVLLTPTPALAQSTNQLFMTGTGSGHAPVLYTNGVDTNINLAIMPKGTGMVGIGTATPTNTLNVAASTIPGIELSVSGTEYATLGAATGSGLYSNVALTGDAVLRAADNNLILAALNASGNIYMTTGSTDTAKLTILNAGSVGIGNTSPGSLLDVGLAGTTTGNLRLEGKTSGYVQISPSAAAGSWTMTLPTGVPASNGYVLSSTTAGVTSWVANGGGGATALSALTSGTAVNTIDNTSMAQTWTWNSLTTQTAFTLSSSSLTNGSIVSIQNTAASVTSTGKVLSISDATTGSGYGVYSSMTGHGNTGYAGYFNNTDTSSSTNYGVYGISNSTNGYGVYGTGQYIGVYGSTGNSNGFAFYGQVFGGANTATAGYFTNGSTGVGYGVQGTITGHGNTGYAGYFKNTDTSSNVNYGVYGITSSTGASSGVYGEADCANCYGVYGYSTNANGVLATGGYNGVYAHSFSTGTGNAVYALIDGAGNTGYAGYFSNTDTSSNVNYGIYASAAGANAYAGAFNGNVKMIGTNGLAFNTNGWLYWSNSGTWQGILLENVSLETINLVTKGAAPIVFATNNSEAMRITSTGSVGIGTTSPAATLDVVSTSTGAAYALRSTLNSTNTGYAGYFTNTDTASVSYGLYASTSSATGWAGYFNGNVYVNGTITMSSDRRMKKDIEPLDTEDALDGIALLRPVAFTWKKTGVEDMGLIAQEVDLVYPDLVTHSGADETLALKYTSLIAPMIASIQELKKRDDQLETENAALRRDFNAYKEAHP